jgi:sec-independent protein translocase protein TatA
MDLFAPNHFVLILLVVLLLFGGKKIPELMKGLGKWMREFKNAKDNVAQSLNNDMFTIKEVEPADIKTL